jgi:hypothetical protein
VNGWIGFNWLRIGSNEEIFWTRLTFGFHTEKISRKTLYSGIGKEVECLGEVMNVK